MTSTACACCGMSVGSESADCPSARYGISSCVSRVTLTIPFFSSARALCRQSGSFSVSISESAPSSRSDTSAICLENLAGQVSIKSCAASRVTESTGRMRVFCRALSLRVPGGRTGRSASAMVQ